MSEPQPGGPTGPGPSFTAPVGQVGSPETYRSAARTAAPTPLTPSPLPPKPNPDLSTQPAARDFSPPRRWLPAVLTIVALALVGGVVAVASLRPAPTRTASGPVVAPVRLAPQSQGGSASSTTPTTGAETTQVPFSTAYGEGVLTLVDHRRTASGRLLVLTVTVTAVRGQIEVEPTSFSILDAAGTTHELSFARSSGNDLEAALLTEGQSITGRVRFAVPAGHLVLLMEDPLGGVTALTIPD